MLADRKDAGLKMTSKKPPKHQTEISFSDNEIPVPPNVRPVIVLNGSDYEMGFQYYQQLAQIFGLWILELISKSKPTEAEIKFQKISEKYIKRCAPEMIDMFNGMAAGATAAGVPLSYQEVLAHFIEMRDRGISPQERFSDCSGFAAWDSATKNGKFICAGGTDHWLTFEVTLVVFPENGNNFICSPFHPTQFGNTGCHPAMNNKGLAYVHHGATHWIQCRPRDKWTDGIPSGIANVHTLRFANSAVETRDMQLGYPSRDGYAGGFWADLNGNAFVIECREDPQAIRQAGDYDEKDFLYATNNALHKDLGHCQNPPPKGNVYIPHGGWLGSGITISSVSRNLGIWNMLHNYHGEVDLEFVKMMWRFSGKQPSFSTLEAADAAYYETQGEGWDTKICSLTNGIVGIMVPDNGCEGLYYVCNGCASQIAFPQYPHGHYYQIAPTYSFYQLKLASGPKEAVQAAKVRSKYELYYANRELRKLGYAGTAYGLLDEIFNQAVNEWNKGHYYLQGYEGLVIGFKPKKRANIYDLSNAIRAFTRCQALARKVYNALVPPAVSPEDLGLQPWGYWEK